MNDTWDPSYVITTNEYGKGGMTLTDEWQDFKATITLPDTYKNMATIYVKNHDIVISKKAFDANDQINIVMA